MPGVVLLPTGVEAGLRWTMSKCSCPDWPATKMFAQNSARFRRSAGASAFQKGSAEGSRAK